MLAVGTDASNLARLVLPCGTRLAGAAEGAGISRIAWLLARVCRRGAFLVVQLARRAGRACRRARSVSISVDGARLAGIRIIGANGLGGGTGRAVDAISVCSSALCRTVVPAPQLTQLLDEVWPVLMRYLPAAH